MGRKKKEIQVVKDVELKIGNTLGFDSDTQDIFPICGECVHVCSEFRFFKKHFQKHIVICSAQGFRSTDKCYGTRTCKKLYQNEFEQIEQN